MTYFVVFGGAVLIVPTHKYSLFTVKEHTCIFKIPLSAHCQIPPSVFFILIIYSGSVSDRSLFLQFKRVSAF